MIVCVERVTCCYFAMDGKIGLRVNVRRMRDGGWRVDGTREVKWERRDAPCKDKLDVEPLNRGILTILRMRGAQ
jgi:hypothetical protein